MGKIKISTSFPGRSGEPGEPAEHLERHHAGES
jgi:hypothetical protein